MATILKLQYPYDTLVSSVLFDHQEAQELIAETQQEADVQFRQNRKPRIYFTGPEWDIFTALVYPRTPTTSDKVNTMRAVTDKIKLTLYSFNGTEQFNAQVKIDPAAELYYIAGGKDARKLMKMVFYEVS